MTSYWQTRRQQGYWRRNRSERLIDILLVLGEAPAVRTSIRQGANLNDHQLGDDLPFLLEKQLIEETEPAENVNNTTYGLTEKARELLRRYGAFMSLLRGASP